MQSISLQYSKSQDNRLETGTCRQTGVTIVIRKNGDRKECISMSLLLTLPGKAYDKCLEKRCRAINEPKLNDTQCGFRLCRSTTEHSITLRQIFEKSWEYAIDVSLLEATGSTTCFLRKICYSLHLPNKAFNIDSIGCQIRVSKPDKTKRYYVSLETQASTCCK